MHGKWFGAGYSGGLKVSQITSTKHYIRLIEKAKPADLLDYYAMRHDVSVTVSYLKNEPSLACCANLKAAWGFCTTCTFYGCCAAPGLVCASLFCWNGTFCFCFQCRWNRYDCGTRVPIDELDDLNKMIECMNQVKQPTHESMIIDENDNDEFHDINKMIETLEMNRLHTNLKQ
jgi:hypothetical protein